MTVELPFYPILPISATADPNDDLPPEDFPSLVRIIVTDLVGPLAANQQDRAFEKRDEYLRSVIVDLATNNDHLDLIFLRRDGSAQQDSVAGITANMPMNGHKLTGLGAPTAGSDSATKTYVDAETTRAEAEEATLATAITTETTRAEGVEAGILSTLTHAVLNNTTNNFGSVGRLLGLLDPTTNQEAATKHYVDDAIAALPIYPAYGYKWDGSITVTFTAISTVYVQLQAAGAGGGGGSDNRGGGGGGAGMHPVMVNLTSGDTIAFALGTGGAGGVADAGSNGAASYVTVTVGGIITHYLQLNGGAGADAGGAGGAGGVAQVWGGSGTGSWIADTALGVAGGTGTVGPGGSGGAGANGGASVFGQGGFVDSTGGHPIGPLINGQNTGFTGGGGLRGSGGSGGGNLAEGQPGGNGHATLLVFSQGP